VWEQVNEVLRNPHRLEKEYNKRLEEYAQSEAYKYDPSGLEKQLRKLKQGASRLIDSYAEGLIEREEFEPRIKNLKCKIALLESQLSEIKNEATAQHELSLVINHLKQFSETVQKNLSETDFNTQREIIRALVKRIEIYKDEVVVIFRIEPLNPTYNDQADLSGQDGKSGLNSHFMQDCKRSYGASLRYALIRWKPKTCFSFCNTGSQVPAEQLH
jgi:site-specific DNA recombinase